MLSSLNICYILMKIEYSPDVHSLIFLVLNVVCKCVRADVCMCATTAGVCACNCTQDVPGTGMW